MQDKSVKEPPLKISGNADRYNHRDGNDDYRQAGDLFRLMSASQKQQLFDNIKAAMDGVPMEIVKRQVAHFYRADRDYGIGVATRMGMSAKDVRRGAGRGVGGAASIAGDALACHRLSPIQRGLTWRNAERAERSISDMESAMSNQIMTKLVAEFIGTFSFVFIGAGTAAVIGDGVGLPGMAAIALAHGLAIMAFAFAYGSVSGGHMNPAVTVGVLAAGAMDPIDAIGYVASQLVGGIAGALLLRTLLGGVATGLGTPELAHDLALGGVSLTITPVAGFVIEAVLAFFLVTVVLSTAVAGRAGNLAPLAIGMTLTFNILMGGALTGAAFNPARALGPMVATGKFDDAWLYVAAPIVGAVIAAILHTGLCRLAQEEMASTRMAETPAE